MDGSSVFVLDDVVDSSVAVGTKIPLRNFSCLSWKESAWSVWLIVVFIAAVVWFNLKSSTLACIIASSTSSSVGGRISPLTFKSPFKGFMMYTGEEVCCWEACIASKSSNWSSGIGSYNFGITNGLSEMIKSSIAGGTS